MLEFLRKTDGRIPNLAGIKFTSTNLMSLQECLEFEDGRFNILFGCDEMLLSALALGVPGAVDSTYNYCAPLYHKIIAAHQAGDLATAQALQMKSVKLVQVLLQFGVLAAGKALMNIVGVDCGPVRPPVRRLTEEQKTRLFHQVEALGILRSAPASRSLPTEVCPWDRRLRGEARGPAACAVDLGSCRGGGNVFAVSRLALAMQSMRNEDSNYDTASP
jgi:hypothetical protein